MGQDPASRKHLLWCLLPVTHVELCLCLPGQSVGCGLGRMWPWASGPTGSSARPFPSHRTPASCPHHRSSPHPKLPMTSEAGGFGSPRKGCQAPCYPGGVAASCSDAVSGSPWGLASLGGPISGSRSLSVLHCPSPSPLGFRNRKRQCPKVGSQVRAEEKEVAEAELLLPPPPPS